MPSFAYHFAKSLALLLHLVPQWEIPLPLPLGITTKYQFHQDENFIP